MTNTSEVPGVVDPSEMDSVFDQLHQVDIERLEAAIGAGAARIAAMQCKWLLLLAEFVERRGFDRWQMTAEQWLSWRCSLDRTTAREHLRVAGCLQSLPVIREAFGQGRLSYSKVRTITRIATPGDEQDWVDTAIAVPAATLARMVGTCRTVTKQDEQQLEANRSLSWRWDETGMLVGQFRLTADEGAAFIAQIEQTQTGSNHQPVDSAESTTADPPVDAAASTGSLAPVDALLTLIHGSHINESAGLVASTQPEIVLHVTAGELNADQPSRRHLANDQPVGPGAARRMACDPILTALLHDDTGRVIDVGRRHRLVTARLRRAVYERDHHRCTYPGCTNSRWLDVHHIIHWEDGGTTDYDNLLLLCGTHHRAHHNDSFTITMINGAPVFETPNQHLIHPAPTMRALPAPPGDLLPPPTTPLGPIEGTWDGFPIDHNYATTCLAQNSLKYRNAS